MEMQGDVVGGHMHFCSFCKGILASDRWLSTHMKQPILRNVRTGVFDGSSADYRCPSCEGEMVKGPVPTPQGLTIEVDGCLKCGSLWFDNRELEPFYPEIQDVLPAPPSPLSSTAVVRDVIERQIRNISALFERKKDDSEE